MGGGEFAIADMLLYSTVFTDVKRQCQEIFDPRFFVTITQLDSLNLFDFAEIVHKCPRYH